MRTGVIGVVLLNCLAACVAWVTPGMPGMPGVAGMSGMAGMWPGGMGGSEGAGGGGEGSMNSQMMQMVQQDMFTGGQTPVTPSSLVTYDTAARSSSMPNMQTIQNMQQMPVNNMQALQQMPVPNMQVLQKMQQMKVPNMQPFQQSPMQTMGMQPVQGVILPGQMQAPPVQMKTPDPPSGKPPGPINTGYTMGDWIKFVSAGVAAVSGGQNLTPKDIIAAFSARGGQTTVGTTTKITTTTEKPTTTALSTKMTLGQLLISSLSKANKTKGPVQQEARGCYYKGQWYKPESEVERGQSGNWCYGTYCNKASVVIHWDDHKCTAPLTTPPVFSALKKKETNNLGLGQAPTALQQAVFGLKGMQPQQQTMNQGGMGINMFGPAPANALNSANGMFDPLKQLKIQQQAQTTTTQSSSMGCIHKGQWYAPGADITNLRDYGRCFGTYCDFKSKIVNWSDRCTATVAPFTPPAPTQSMQSMQRQMQQLESFMK